MHALTHTHTHNKREWECVACPPTCTHPHTCLLTHMHTGNWPPFCDSTPTHNNNENTLSWTCIGMCMHNTNVCIHWWQKCVCKSVYACMCVRMCMCVRFKFWTNLSKFIRSSVNKFLLRPDFWSWTNIPEKWRNVCNHLRHIAKAEELYLLTLGLSGQHCQPTVFTDSTCSSTTQSTT